MTSNPEQEQWSKYVAVLRKHQENIICYYSGSFVATALLLLNRIPKSRIVENDENTA